MKNRKDVSVFNDALTISLPSEVRELKKPHTIIGDDLKYIVSFANPDSTIQVNIEFLDTKTKQFVAGMLEDQVDLLRHLNASLLILETKRTHQNGSDMLSILYELPRTKDIDGVIVERRLLFTSQGLAVIDMMNSFKHPQQKEKCIKFIRTISDSIRANNDK
jgi:hypothetical protein